MRPSSLGGAAYCVALCPSVRLSVRPVIVAIGNVFSTTASVTSRYLANYNDTHVLFGTHRGPHIVGPSWPHKLVNDVMNCCNANFNCACDNCTDNSSVGFTVSFA